MTEEPRSLFVHQKLKDLIVSNIELRDALKLLANHLAFLEEQRRIGAADRKTIIAAIKRAESAASDRADAAETSKELH
jgi:hypothetical protein